MKIDANLNISVPVTSSLWAVMDGISAVLLWPL